MQYRAYRDGHRPRVSVVDVSAFNSIDVMYYPGGPYLKKLKILQDDASLYAQSSTLADCIATYTLSHPAKHSRPMFETLEIGQGLYAMLQRDPESAVDWHFLSLLVREKQSEIVQGSFSPTDRTPTLSCRRWRARWRWVAWTALTAAAEAWARSVESGERFPRG